MEYSGRIQVLDSGDLLISNVRETDAGLYACVRSNEAGSVNGQAYLSVMGKCDVVLFIIIQSVAFEFSFCFHFLFPFFFIFVNVC